MKVGRYTSPSVSLQFRNIDGAGYGLVINWTMNRSTLTAAKWWSDKIFFLSHFYVLPMLELSLSKVAFSGTRITMIVWLFFESIDPLLLSEEIIIKRHKCFISIITKISNLLLICSLSQYIVECGLLSRFAKNNGFFVEFNFVSCSEYSEYHPSLTF